MKFPWTRISDEEFVAMIRRDVERVHVYRIVHLLGLVVMCCLGGWFLNLALQNVNRFGGEFAAIHGFVVGAIFTTVASHLVRSTEQLIAGTRTEQVLLQYHDSLEDVLETAGDRQLTNEVASDIDDGWLASSEALRAQPPVVGEA